MADPTSARRGCSLGGNISHVLAVGVDMAKRKSPFTVATSADRPELSVAQVLRAAQEANLLAAELMTEAQILIKINAEQPGSGQLSKSTTMRLRGLTEILAGEE